ncbi:MAG TPA: NAD(P)-dependent oxidoreductase [Lacunisphaera sp.]|nr:NAD(P)-dependent oxidoreductase [Lacunisphaera sp.]
MQPHMSNHSLAFIGTGVMGRSMAGHLLKAGHTLHVFNRTRARAQALLDAGAHWHDTAGAAAAQADFVFTIVGFPTDVEETYFGPHGVLAHAKRGAVLIDMTTSSPLLAQRIAEAAEAKDLAALDAPVSGGDVGAREARLVIMVGGGEAAFARAKPLFEVMGKNVALLGGPGAGQHCKMANQISIASIMTSWCEALTYAKKAGLDPARVIESIGAGAAASWSLNNLAPRALRGDYAPGFYVKHFLKDMRIALESAEAMKLELPGLVQAKKLYDEVARRGWEDCGTQALFRLYAGEK